MAKDPNFKPVDEWFIDWLDHFLILHGRPWWPKEGTDEYRVWFGNWKVAFRRNGLHDREVADEISSLLAEDPPEQDRHFLPAILKLVRKIHHERSIEARGAVVNTLEGLRDESKDCQYCQGRGMAIVWHPAPSEVRIEYKEFSNAAWCICKYGLWVAQYHRTKGTEGIGNLPNVATILEKKSGWLLVKPGWEKLPVWRGRLAVDEAAEVLVAKLAKQLPAPPPPQKQQRLPSLPDHLKPPY